MTIQQSKRYNVYLVGAIIIIIILLAGCAPAPIEDTPIATTEWLNANPDMEFGGCDMVVFINSQGNKEYIYQCWPDGYRLYADVGNYPIRIEFTGDAYSTRPLNTFGSIGYWLPAMTLAPDTYILKVYGLRDMWGHAPDFSMVAHCNIEGVPGDIVLGVDDLAANGSYRAMFVLNAPQAGVYNCAVYLRIIHPSMTADAYLTFSRITVEVAPE